ncbi:GGDEF domain-containing protein [Alteromonas macleodii]|jgi:diguanylate cyclase (GGDEF)-like protein|uniref:diguanylate cyclase n=1 Tax=Alteromonas macleodii TaxID=28108 RepID=A0A126PUU2_ALTMA|nr:MULTISPECIES: GGDEF domain-containing protein [Alteromonas]MCP4282238.1 GGDEF domain-containing protein [Alteromonas sp.]MEC9163653.1 GGDEF domain-containing protein [Pseudomonadota bacterium]NKX20994.1 GGDEF domain-containing protein [Alteromonadaceae bacterium A_SAG2]NKX31876.1 GGDEF domain-containing protein [Alteromonadaceae bacterium A_SAG1]AMJ96797.1 response regulator [Alteromonas macleodii]|tara:strand:- start:896 stop:1957 length:1062 start_codon:yes stop_codon:yes gene_type:complete
MDSSSLRQLLRSAQQDEAEAKRRRLTLYFISYVGGTIMAFMAWINMGTNNPLLVGTLAGSAAFVYANVALSHMFPRVDVFYYLAGLVVAFTINGLVYTGGLNNTGLYFIFPLLFIQIVVVRFKPAMVYVAVTMGIAIFMLYNQEKIVAEYPAEHVSRFLIATFCFICVAFIGENFWHQSRKEMLRENLERMRQANTDPLTKLPNRRFLEAVFFERAMQDPGAHFPLSAVVVDIDHFKTINDTYGHDIGDEVLIHITRLMKEAVRTTDVVARTGGEEFLVLFPHATLSQAVKLAEKMRKVVEANPFVEGDVNHSITASFGVATALTDTNLHACLKQADDNLYKAKNAGRNRVVE